MKKLLIIMESMQGGGAERVLLNLLESIDKNRYDLTLLIVFRRGVLLQSIPKDIKTLFLYPGKPHGLRRLIEHFVIGRDYLYRRDVRRLTAGMEWDTIVSFMEGPTLKIHNCILDKGKRNVSWVHANLLVGHWTKFLYHDDNDEAEDYKELDKIVFVSQGAKDAFIKKFGISDDRVEIIHNVIPVAEIRRKSVEFKVTPEESSYTICTVGRLVVQKRFDRLLEALSELHQCGMDIKLWILGTGPLEDELKAKAQSLGISGSIRFLGFQTNPYPYIAASDAFVLSSDTEGYPTVVCEAMTLGKPIISTAITGSNELLDNGVGVLTPLNPSALASGIKKVLDSKEFSCELSKRALEAATSFDTQTVLSHVYHVIDGNAI